MIELAGNIIIREHKILLLNREDEDHWDVPGGKVKDEESPTNAAIREAEEEIEAELTLEKPFYSGEFGQDGEIYLWHGYIAQIEDNSFQLKNSDLSMEAKWCDIQSIKELELSPNLKMIEPGLLRLLEQP